jgi:hypothetical protein
MPSPVFAFSRFAYRPPLNKAWSEGDVPELASYPRIEERELEAGGLN